MDQDNKQNTSGQTPGGDLPPLSGTGVNTPGADVKTPEKTSTDAGLPVKPEVVKPKIASVPVAPDEVGGGLPPLDTAEDETFNPEVVKEEKVKVPEIKETGSGTLPPLSGNDVGGANEGLKEVKEMGEVNDENQETPPPPPPEEVPVAPGKTEDKPLATEGVDMGDDGGEKKKGKKKISKKTIAGALIALVLLVGVPVLALNLGYFRGDVRERAWIPEDPDSSRPTSTPTSISRPSRPSRPRTTTTRAPTEAPTKAPTRRTSNTGPRNITTSTWCDHSGTNTANCDDVEEGVSCRIIINGSYVDDGTCEIINSDSIETECKCVGGEVSPAPLTSTPTPWEPSDECVKDGGCIEPGQLCCSGWEYDQTNPGDSVYCPVTETRCVSGGTVTPTKSPTKTPTTGICVDIKIYTLQDSVWTETFAAEVGQYASTGDTIRLALKGNSSAFVNGRFKVTAGGVSGSWITSSKKNGNGELYIDYELASGGSYSVEG